jgi:hypothetical protein
MVLMSKLDRSNLSAVTSERSEQSDDRPPPAPSAESGGLS